MMVDKYISCNKKTITFIENLFVSAISDMKMIVYFTNDFVIDGICIFATNIFHPKF